MTPKPKKKKWRSYTLVAIFILTLCALGNFSIKEQLKNTTLSKTPANMADGYQATFVLDLGDVESRDYRRMGSVRAFLDFSPDGKFLAVGTEHGEIIVVRKDGAKNETQGETQGKTQSKTQGETQDKTQSKTQGETQDEIKSETQDEPQSGFKDKAKAAPQVIWREKTGIGKITSLKFSDDGAFLYVGESSPDGSLFCLDAKTGKKLWQYSSAGAIGVDIRQKSLPAVIKTAVRQGKVYALATRYGTHRGNELLYFSKVLCFDQTGNIEWEFPGESYMDAWVNWFSIDSGGGQVVFGTANYSNNGVKYNKTIYALNAQTGAENWSIAIPPISQTRPTVMRGSPNISADGKMIAALASDGRGFTYDVAGRFMWGRAISEPKLIGSVYLNAIGRDAYVIGDYVVFGTLNTYNSANWQLSTPVEHPSSNNIVVFDRSGNFKSRWQAGGSVEDMAFSYPYVGLAIGRNTKTKDSNVHGLYLYHLENGQIMGKIITDGPAVAAAVCAQGKSAAVVETSLKLDDGKIIGKYRLIMAQKV